MRLEPNKDRAREIGEGNRSRSWNSGSREVIRERLQQRDRGTFRTEPQRNHAVGRDTPSRIERSQPSSPRMTVPNTVSTPQATEEHTVTFETARDYGNAATVAVAAGGAALAVGVVLLVWPAAPERASLSWVVVPRSVSGGAVLDVEGTF